jgi:hypothetical protein
MASRSARRRFLRPLQHQLVEWRLAGQAVDRGVEVGVLHAQLDQPPIGECRLAVMCKIA